jgi:formiminotetrahydrofolate cyclodeaminase
MEKIEPIDIIFSIVMVASSFTLTLRWLTLYGNKDAVIVSSAVILIIGLSCFLLNINLHLHRIEDSMDTKERALRINIKSIEESMDGKMDSITRKVSDEIEEISKRTYR